MESVYVSNRHQYQLRTYIDYLLNASLAPILAIGPMHSLMRMSAWASRFLITIQRAYWYDQCNSSDTPKIDDAINSLLPST